MPQYFEDMRIYGYFYGEDCFLFKKLIVTLSSILMRFELLTDTFPSNVYQYNINRSYVSVKHSILSPVINNTDMAAERNS
jgi:hypothetical protein